MAHQQRKTPACEAGAEVLDRDRRFRGGGLRASDCDSITPFRKPKASASGSALATSARNAWLIGRVYRVHPMLVMESRIVLPPQISRGAATPLDHDAPRSPANPVVSKSDGGLRLKSESECGDLKKETRELGGSRAEFETYESVATFGSTDSTIDRFIANPLQKGPLAAVRGGVQVRTYGTLQKSRKLSITQLHTQESLAQAVCTKIFLGVLR